MAIDDNTVYGLTGAQIKELPGKIDAAKGKAKELTTADYNYDKGNTGSNNCVALWKLEAGLYTIRKGQTVKLLETSESNPYNTGVGFSDPAIIVMKKAVSNSERGSFLVINKYGGDEGLCSLITNITDSGGSNFSVPFGFKVVDNPLSTRGDLPLSANQGRALNNKITPSSGSGAPTTSTVGILGKIYIDTSTVTAYMCVAVSGSNYTWKQITA